MRIVRGENTDRRGPAQVAVGPLLILLTPLGLLGAQTLRGTVLDASSRVPIAGTSIQVQSDRGSQPRRATTDSVGSFTINMSSAGLYTIVATRIGYIQHRGDTVRIRDSESVKVEIALDRSIVVLRPVIVVERISWLPDGFEQRRAAGFGRFLTRMDIENRRGSRTTDLLRGMPGLQLIPARRGRGSGNALMMRGTAGLCSPAVWIDGIPITDGGNALDDLLNPSALEAVEVYNSTTNAPIQYRTGNCGVLLFWTRRGPTEDRARIKLWKLAVGATVGVGLVFLLRK
jgi:hypothetical protein